MFGLVSLIGDEMKDNFSLDLYRVFAAVYENRSFSEAARQLFVTQSAVSQSIKQLEVMLGVQLFLRGKRAATPSVEAEKLYAMIAPAIGTICEAEERIERFKLLREGFLRVGAADTVARHFLLPYLKRWNELYPDVRLQVVNRTSTEAFSLLAAGKLDVAFVNSPVSDSKFSVKKCLDLHDVFIAGSAFSELRGCTVTRRELSSYPLIMLEKLSNTRRAIDEEFMRSGIALNPEIDLGCHDLLVDFARINLGISCVTREFAAIDGELFELKLDEPLPVRELDLCWVDAGCPSEAKKKFIDMF